MPDALGCVVVVLEVIVVEVIVVVGRVVFVSSAGVVLDSAVVSRSAHADRIRAKPSRAAIRQLRFATRSGEASCAPPRWCRCRCVPIPLTLHVHNKPTRAGKAAVRLDIATWFSARLANIRDVGWWTSHVCDLEVEVIDSSRNCQMRCALQRPIPNAHGCCVTARPSGSLDQPVK